MGNQNERNVNITLKNEDTDREEIIISFTSILNMLKRFLAIWLVAAIVIGILIPVGSAVFSADQHKNLTALVSFNYDGIEKGLAPDKTQFDINTIKNPSVIRGALEKLDLPLDTLEDIRKNISIEGVIPDDAIARITMYKSVYEQGNLNAGERMLETSYFPTQYRLTFNYSSSGLSGKDAVAVFDTMLKEYREYFFKNYGFNRALGSAVRALDYSTYDYAEAVDVFNNTLTKMQNTNALNERRYALYITMAMIVFMVVIIIGVYVGVNMRNTAKDNEYKLKSDAYKSLIESKQVIEKELERDQEGLKAAFEVYQLIENGSFKEAVDRFVEIRDKLTHPAETALLEQRIDDIRWQLAENAYNDGYSKYNVSNYEQARDAFFESLAFKENTSYTPRLYYYLAMSLFQLNDYEGARRYFAMINTSELNSEMDANTKYYWGISAEKIGDESEAFEQYDSFLKKYRYHRLADEVVKKRARVESARPGR